MQRPKPLEVKLKHQVVQSISEFPSWASLVNVELDLISLIFEIGRRNRLKASLSQDHVILVPSSGCLHRQSHRKKPGHTKYVLDGHGFMDIYGNRKNPRSQPKGLPELGIPRFKVMSYDIVFLKHPR